MLISTGGDMYTQLELTQYFNKLLNIPKICAKSFLQIFKKWSALYVAYRKETFEKRSKFFEKQQLKYSQMLLLDSDLKADFRPNTS